MLKIETTQHVLGILEKSKQCAIDLNQKSVSEDIFFYIFMSNLSSTMLRAFSHININPEDLWNEA